MYISEKMKHYEDVIYDYLLYVWNVLKSETYVAMTILVMHEHVLHGTEVG